MKIVCFCHQNVACICLHKVSYSICWLPIIKGGKLVWYNVVVTNFCSNFCCETTRSRENTHYLLTYIVGC